MVVRTAASSRLQSSLSWSETLRMAGVLPSADQPVLLLTASLFTAPEPPREARRGTVVRPDYGGYCCVLCVPAPTLTRVEVWIWVEDKMSVDAPDRLTSVAGRVSSEGDGVVVIIPIASSGSPSQLYVTLGVDRSIFDVLYYKSPACIKDGYLDNSFLSTLSVNPASEGDAIYRCVLNLPFRPDRAVKALSGVGSYCGVPVASSATRATFVTFWWFVQGGVHTGTVFGAWVRRWRGGFASLELAQVCVVARRLVVRRLFRNASSVGYPRFFVSQARCVCCARGLSRYSVTYWAPASHVTSASLTELGPESLKVPGMGLQSGLRVRGYETESGVCLGGGTVMVVVLWGYLVVVAPVASSATRAAFAAFRWFVRRGVHAGTVFGTWVRWWHGGFASLELARVAWLVCFPRLVVRHLFRNASSVGYPRFFVSQARCVCCARAGLRVRGYETESGVCLGGGIVKVVVPWGYLVVVGAECVVDWFVVVNPVTLRGWVACEACGLGDRLLWCFACEAYGLGIQWLVD
ncbi:hypothetical protein Taro_008990 [Colocasia esculenta]|uniref:Uncharacterized protein n=1 Tax=Colocasia esculenta TaxID=4460 RepID=A0A843U8Q0_COLES|nr:hypothetical protein [Colocasia esculenta]